MAQSQVATPVPDVGKLRPVLDYIPCETCLDMYSPEQDYYCAICPRLTRDIVVRRSALGTDEAVQVIPAEDFSMAKDLRDRIQSQELELQEAREKLAAVGKREMDVQAELARLNDDLLRARKDRDEAQLIPFEFVGVREGQREEGLMEFGEEDQAPRRLGHQPTALAWEPAPEESGQAATDWQPPAEPAPAPAATAPEAGQPAATTWEEVPEDAEAGTGAPAEPAETPSFQATEEVPAPTAPPPPPRPAAAPTTDDAIARIEAEIAKIEQELQQVAEQEKQLGGGDQPKPKR
ncbi:MAG TPA: hypothetical protein VGB18_04800, partial [Candidatus Thermoplasmatota archaeon]